MGLTVRPDSTAGRSVPAVKRGIVSRGHLVERLRQAERVVHISAPPGSGKTILLHSWINEDGLERSTAWVSIHGDHRDPERFWISVTDALRGTAPASRLVKALSAAPNLDGWAVVERLLADLGRLALGDRDDLDEVGVAAGSLDAPAHPGQAGR